MRSEMPDRRPDIRGIVHATDVDTITVAPFNLEANPWKDLSREEIREKMRSLTQEERRQHRAEMEKNLLSEMMIFVPEDISIYKKMRPRSRGIEALSIQDIEQSNIASVWLAPIQPDQMPTAEFITIFSPELYNE